MNDFSIEQAGLSHAEVAKRLAKDGYNEIATKEISIIGKFVEQYTNFLMLLLIFGATVSFFLGQQTDAFVIVVILLVNGTLGTFQEYRAEKLAQALKSHIPQKARVRRGGKEITIDRREIVEGDIIFLSEGQLVPADALVVETKGILVDESLLTGESAGITKSTADKSNILYSGSLIVGGECIAHVTATGERTEFGKIVSFTHTSKKRSSFLHQINELSDFLFKITVIIGILLFGALEYFRPEIGISTIFLFSVAMVIAIVPEVLPLISTLALSRASLALAKKGVLVKRLSSLEDLGGVEIICTDKTGTLTENKLSVVQIESKDEIQCLKAALYASKELKNSSTVFSASFDVGLWKYTPDDIALEVRDTNIVFRSPFDFEFRWQYSISEENWLYIKGASETVLSRCEISLKGQALLLEEINKNEKQGLRCLVIARKKVDSKKEYNEKDIAHLEYCGLIYFHDPVKETVKATLSRSKELGLDIKILTGDSLDVALHVAKQVGIDISSEEVLTGEDMQKIPEQDRYKKYKTIKIFARINPKEKFEIISVLAQHASVLFLGEGVNDAPALKRADVGIVVEQASDIAKESADIILTKTDLSVIVEGIYMGRQIMNNIAKYILITLTGNFGSLFSLSIISTIASALPLLPTQVLLENILTDVPMIGVVNAPISFREQQKPVKQKIKEICIASFIISFATLIIQLAFYYFYHSLPEELFRTLWLEEIILFEFMLIISLRTFDWFWKAPALPFKTTIFFVGIVLGSIVLPYIPLLGQAFHLVRYSFVYLFPILLFLLVGLGATECMKVTVFRKQRS